MNARVNNSSTGAGYPAKLLAAEKKIKHAETYSTDVRRVRMHEQMVDAIRDTALGVVQAPSWQKKAVEEYEGSFSNGRGDLRVDLAARLLALTGQPISSQDSYADPDGRLAVADVDGEMFRLWRRGREDRFMTLVRPCTYCGTGRFESPEIASVEDLGYALSAWRPFHVDCYDNPLEDLPDF
jgi:hypothetical protein